MATKDTGGQDRASRRREEVEEVPVEETSDVQERVGKLTDDVDSLLDDIDNVLEANAEDFVRAFVQKGGNERALQQASPRHSYDLKEMSGLSGREIAKRFLAFEEES